MVSPVPIITSYPFQKRNEQKKGSLFIHIKVEIFYISVSLLCYSYMLVCVCAKGRGDFARVWRGVDTVERTIAILLDWPKDEGALYG